MRKFYTRELTPLRFHKLYHWVITPINIVMVILTLLWGGPMTPLIIVYNTLLLISCILTFTGCFKFRKYAWWAIMGGFALEVFYSVYFVVFYAVKLPEYTMVAVNQVIWRFVAVILMGIYYFKRRPLFFYPVPIEEIPEEYREKSK